jgi:hypothetical protein
LEKSVIEIQVTNRWKMTGPSANYWWHPRLLHNLRGLHWEPRGSLIPALNKGSMASAKILPVHLVGCWQKILKWHIHAKGAGAHELILNSVTARGRGMGIVYLIEERSLIITYSLTHSPEFVESEIQVEK